MKRHSILDGVVRPSKVRQGLTLDELNPQQHSPLQMQNRVRLQVVGPNERGEIVTKQDVIASGNVMATYGLSQLVSFLGNGTVTASNWIGGMRIGTDNTAANSTQSRLLASTGSIDLTDAGDVVASETFSLRCLGTFASNNPAGAASIQEIGLYASSDITTGIVARKVLTGAESVNKGASDSINVSYDIIFTTC